MNQIKVFWNGLVKENPTFVLLLGFIGVTDRTVSMRAMPRFG